MRRISDYIGRELRWQKTRSGESELQCGEERIGTFRIATDGLSTYTGTVELDEGCWNFESTLFSAGPTITTCGSRVQVVALWKFPFVKAPRLELANGRTILATQSFWGVHCFKTEGGKVLLRGETRFLLPRNYMTVEIKPEAAAFPELPWLTALAWYRSIMDEAISGA